MRPSDWPDQILQGLFRGLQASLQNGKIFERHLDLKCWQERTRSRFCRRFPRIAIFGQSQI
jgi:hypothetical protein